MPKLHILSVRLRIATLALTAAFFAPSCGSPTAATPPPPPTDPPKIMCPDPQTVVSPLGDPISVVYGMPTVAGGKSPIATSCTPSSGSTFAVGATTVTCTALDAQQRADSCIFTITVNPPPRISLTRFVAFGDSITKGEDGNQLAAVGVNPFDWHPNVVLTGQDYPFVLQTNLQNTYTLQRSSIGVVNQGNPSERASGMSPNFRDTLTRFSLVVLNAGYQAVLILEGSNDLYDEYFVGPTIESRAIDNLRTMIRTARGAGIRPFLATLPPADPSGSNLRGHYVAPYVDGFNVKLRNLALSEGISLVDVNQAFGGDLTLLSADGLHPNAAGYQRMADKFFEVLSGTLQLPSSLPAVALARSRR